MPNPPRRSRLLESTHRLGIGIGATLLVVLAVVLWSVRLGSSDIDESRVPGDTHTFAVEVLNGTTVNGLARRVTRALRREGIDVVYSDRLRTTMSARRWLLRGEEISSRQGSCRKCLASGPWSTTRRLNSCWTSR